MAKGKKKKSLIQWMTAANLISILCVGVLLAINTGLFVSLRANEDYESIATSTSVHVASMLDTLSDGDYSYDEEAGILKKGDVVITDAAFLKSREYNANIHHTIFWGDTRVITDVMDENGQSVVGTKLTDQSIINAVATEGQYVANKVVIYGSKYCVCYYPLKNGDTIVGYVFTGVNQDEVTSLVATNVFASVLIAAVLAAIISVIVARTVRKKSLTFNEKLTSVSDTASEKRGTVFELGHETSENMEQINVAISQMSAAITQQASHTEEIMGTMENFGGNLDNIMQRVSDTAVVTNDSAQLMDELNAQLLSLEEASKENSEEIVNITEQIEEDNQAVESIGQIVNVINDIAFQITILSFNASVEAARAGDAGRGFAVVADSIKDLSDKTQASVNDITNIITTVNEKMVATGQASQNLIKQNDKLVESLAHTKERLGSVVAAFDQISGNIGMIQEESESILVAKNQVIETVSSLAAASEENAAMSEEITATSNVVINTTEGLIKEIDRLKVINETIDDVRSDFINR